LIRYRTKVILFVGPFCYTLQLVFRGKTMYNLSKNDSWKINTNHVAYNCIIISPLQYNIIWLLTVRLHIFADINVMIIIYTILHLHTRTHPYKSHVNYNLLFYYYYNKRFEIIYFVLNYYYYYCCNVGGVHYCRWRVQLQYNANIFRVPLAFPSTTSHPDDWSTEIPES